MNKVNYMSLSSIEGKLQSAIGKKGYWNEFVEFESSVLHKLFIYEVDQKVEDGKPLQSSQAGKEILTKLSSERPEVINQYHPDQLGSLIGMTIWNFFATDEREWAFTSTSGGHSNNLGGYYYFLKA